jgi:hypothetical protein
MNYTFLNNNLYKVYSNKKGNMLLFYRKNNKEIKHDINMNNALKTGVVAFSKGFLYLL